MTNFYCGYEDKLSWQHRNEFIIDIVAPTKQDTVLDLGCGDKDLLNYIKCKEYIGIDQVSKSDIIANLDTDFLELGKIYNYGFCLGVLEYLENPFITISHYSKFAKKWIILTNVGKPPNPSYWRQQLPINETNVGLKNIFKNIELHLKNANAIWVCE